MGSLNDTEKSLDHVELRLDRGESQVKQLSEQIRELQETANVLQEAAEFKDAEPFNSEVSGRTSQQQIASLQRILPAAMLPTLPAAMFLNRPRVNCTSLHAERTNPVLGASSSSFSQVPVATPREGPFVSLVAASQATAFQAAADLPKSKELFPTPAKPAVRSPIPVEERNRGSTDSRSGQRNVGKFAECDLPPPVDHLFVVHSISKNVPHTMLRTDKRQLKSAVQKCVLFLTTHLMR